MAKGTLEVTCPCCEATLKIDVATGAVLIHKEKEKPKLVDDLAAAARKLKEETAKRDEVFAKSFEDHKQRQDVLNKKFDELFKQAKEDKTEGPPKRAFDFD